MIGFNIYKETIEYVPLIRDIDPAITYPIFAGSIRFAATIVVGTALGFPQYGLYPACVWAITSIASNIFKQIQAANSDSPLLGIFSFTTISLTNMPLLVVSLTALIVLGVSNEPFIFCAAYSLIPLLWCLDSSVDFLYAFTILPES